MGHELMCKGECRVTPQVGDGARPVQARSDNGELGGTRWLVWRAGDGLECCKVMDSCNELGIGREVEV